MLFYTHLLLGILFFLLSRNYFSGGNELLFFLLVLLGSLFPDIDESKSTINRWLGTGKIAEFFTRHRGMFHSLLFVLFVFLTISFFSSTYYAYALALGYLSHLLGDVLTPMGLQIFYPFSKFRLHGPIKSGGVIELLLLLLLFLLVLKIILF